MPIAIPQDTANAIGASAAKCESRSLFASRFADPTAKEDARKLWFQSLIAKKPILKTPWHPPAARLVYARLQSRLMVNMAGGVMENAGLSLDRYGFPIIPSSAVKGCARRAALAALREWCETGTQPKGDENLFTVLCAPFAAPAEMIAIIFDTFGWVETDWSDDPHDNCDFRWSAAESWPSIRTEARRLLCNPLAKEFAGTIAFLDARPNRDPELTLDVVTPHHTKYYRGDLAIATDTEEPVPVLFPAVKEQGENEYFTFPVMPLRGAEEKFLSFAQAALRTGLAAFGIGAKTNAGYGWFDATEELNQSIRDSAAAKAKAEAEERDKRIQTEKDAQEAKERRKAKAARAAMTPDELIASLTEPQFDAKVRAYWKEPKKGGPSEEEKKAIITALRGPRIAYWNEFKVRASKGGDLAKSEQAIRTLNKQLNADKMP
jgi:CRISPR-associated protein Cmr6